VIAQPDGALRSAAQSVLGARVLVAEVTRLRGGCGAHWRGL